MKNFRDLAKAWEARRALIAPITPATRRRVETLNRQIGTVPLDAQLDRYLRWLGEMRARNSAPATVAGQLTTALMIARQSRVLLRDRINPDRIPVETLIDLRESAKMAKATGRSRPRHRSATPAELNALMSAAMDRPGEIRFEQVIPFAVATALRRSELLRITWGDLDLERSTLIIRKRKNPKEPVDQKIPLSPTALAILRDLGPRGRHPDLRIFPYNAGSLSNAFTSLCTRAGVRGLMFKDLRSTAAQQLFNRGWSADQVAAITGHKALQILITHYASPEPERLALRLAAEERKAQ
jgi:integrase